MQPTKIEWSQYTWNVLRGCSRVSSGCEHCYAERVAHRFNGRGLAYEGLTKMINHHPVWTGEVRFVEEKLEEPLRLKGSKMIFVNSQSDLFHPQVKDEWIEQIWSVMELAIAMRGHIFQILTKRPEMALRFFTETPFGRSVAEKLSDNPPYRNIWLGTSVEDRKTAAERLPLLRDIPAAVRWVSIEPLLESLGDIRRYLEDVEMPPPGNHDGLAHIPQIHWVVVGGESGPGARPMDPQWARDLRDQCHECNVPFFMKQMGGVRDKHGVIPDDLMIRQYPTVEGIHGNQDGCTAH